MISFENDYSTGAHPRILEALAATNFEPASGYGTDRFCASAAERIRAACADGTADVFFLVGGTQTNAVVISSLLAGYEGVIAADTGHIAVHEAGAIEATGHKAIALPEHDGKLRAAEVEAYLEGFYADANSTLRISYGKVQGYAPNDAVYYKHFTTLRGIMEKDNPDIYDYDVPERLREIYRLRDFGPYTQDGEVPVCFVATNHTTGGNSGSPVLNADGHLIGLNFDRAWDGVMSDLQYHPEICRNISVDIRYVLFIIDKLAGARHLLDEMEIVTE